MRLGSEKYPKTEVTTMPKVAIYLREEEPLSIELLSESILAIKTKHYKRALEILEEVKSIIEEQVAKEVSEE